ncbi:uncharacterized protein LOC114140717 isoform X2 [Xiphophorus couchianus]|uniref:uncharacterized protein LOC114140717 isoform X2 n=1 Tax=Xiphophorus couchianus TaxID=32473 RepID=UPI0010161991|nr:uncharacterized protein LOC114140717 isoform X2 [Xiphophorus couchianus]
MIASSPIRTLSGLWWLLVVLAAASVSSDETIYAKEGGEVTLKPKQASVTDTTKSITWKVGEDLVVDLDSVGTIYYGRFQGRSNLNNRTGELTLRSLTYDLTDVYTIEINGIPIDHIKLIVLAAVPVPTIALSYPEGAHTCTLTCEGNTARAEPVEYRWMTDDTEVPGSTNKTFTVKENSSGVREFSCKMKNPVSENRSKPFANPFKAQSGPRISTGFTVLAILLFLVILVAIGHRMKTGEWFFNKSPNPWEGDFWRNTRAQQPQAAASESNGNTTPLKGKLDEETALTEK